MPDRHASPTGTITALLREARAGDKPAGDRLLQHVYEELRRIARLQIAAVGGPPRLEATELVNAACARLLAADRLEAEDRRHFFFLLGRAMHDVLVEQARSDDAQKRGGGRRREAMVDVQADDRSLTLSVGDLHEALDELLRIDAESAQIVMLRFYCHRSLEEAAELMGCTFAVARGHWEYAKAWLHERLSSGGGDRERGGN